LTRARDGNEHDDDKKRESRDPTGCGGCHAGFNVENGAGR
jgi:hypothetical protein